MEYYNKIDSVYLEALKKHIIYPVIKVELMDYQENVFAEIEKDISIQDEGSISINYQQGVRRSCSLSITNIDGRYLPSFKNRIWINSKFKIYIGIRIPETIAKEENIYWFSQGVYIITDPVAMAMGSDKKITLTGVDKFGIFGSETNFKETEGTYLIPAGTTVQKLIKDILQQDMGNGQMIDSTTPVIDYSIADSTLPYDIKKSPNEYFADILIEIGNIFACDIYYDGEGRLNFVKGNEKTNMDDYDSMWDYVDVLPDISDISMTYDFTNVYNVIKVIGNNPAAPSYESIVENNLTSSPTSIQIIGKKIKYIESSFCYNQERTYDFAKYLLRKYSIMQQSLDFQSSFIPHLDVNKIITITDNYFNYNQQRFVVQSLVFPLNPASTISVTASNSANIPYFEY